MERFETNQKSVKEKSVYLLHLDTPRIVILASVIIGLIILSFLVGMNFINDDKESDIIAGNKLLFDKGRKMSLADKNIPAFPDSNENSLLSDEKILNTETVEDHAKVPGKNRFEKSESTDILTSDNIREIIPPSREAVKKKEPERSVVKRKSKKRIASKSGKSSKNKSTRKKARNRSNVVEVSKNYKKRESSSPHYSIQVASFDRRSKADYEAGTLRKMKYDARISSTRVKGKKYYRVKIGPLFSKRKAIKLLNNIQDIHRYRNSFMVKE